MTKIFFKILPLIILLISLAGCAKNNSADKKSSVSLDLDNDQEVNSNQTSSYTKLVVNENKCSGCGKCVRIDAEHFAFSEYKAIVVSQDNLNSQKLDMAISMCHDKAINLS